MPTVNPRFCITVSEETLQKIDDYWFSNRFKSRSEATVKLIELALHMLENKEDNEKTTVVKEQ